MKPGDQVKALVQIGLMREPKWLEGTLLEDGLVEVNGNRLRLEPGKIKRWRPLEDHQERIDEFAQTQWEELKESVKAAARHFLPNDEIKFDEMERIAEIDNVSILPSLAEITTIAEIREAPCWTAAYYVTTYSHTEPPDCDEVICGNAFSPDQAARLLVDTVFRNRADAYWESVSDAKYAQSLEEIP